jgi:hypothetical protein
MGLKYRTTAISIVRSPAPPHPMPLRRFLEPGRRYVDFWNLVVVTSIFRPGYIDVFQSRSLIFLWFRHPGDPIGTAPPPIRPILNLVPIRFGLILIKPTILTFAIIANVSFLTTMHCAFHRPLLCGSDNHGCKIKSRNFRVRNNPSLYNNTVCGKMSREFFPLI